MKIQTILDRKINLAQKMDDKELERIGHEALEYFNYDDSLRAPWKERTRNALDLALQVMEQKNFPWPKASNIKLPLLTIACVQFSSRVYPALINSSELVHMTVHGPDVDGKKSARADRVSKHMSYQILEEDQGWEEDMDRALISLPIIGSAFKKSYYDPVLKYIVSEHVLAKDLVIPYYARSLEEARRLTQICERDKNYIIERMRRGIYREFELGKASEYEDQLDKDQTQGVNRGDENPPHHILEQHCYLDLDNDGYDEPYVVTLLRDTGKVLRITPRFRLEDIEFSENKRIICIKPRNHFTKYSFIPSPDGGIYDLGFGQLLGPINHSSNTIINQLVDAGTLSNLQSGFLGRGARLKGGQVKVGPGEWVNINATGDDLRKSIVPMPVREPSQVLFMLLGFLVDYAERLSSVSDLMVGKTPGQNTPATTALAAQEEGMKVFTAIYKRVYRGLTNEFRTRFDLNREYLDPQKYFLYLDDQNNVYRSDYVGDNTDIKPAADPSIATHAQRLSRAQAIAQRAQSVPGYNQQEVEKRLLTAMDTEAQEVVFPTGENAIHPPPDANLELEKEKLAIQRERDQLENTRAIVELKMKAMKFDVEITKLQAETIKLLAQAEAAEVGSQLQEYKMQMDALVLQRDSILSVLRDLDNEMVAGPGTPGAVPGMEGPPGNEGVPSLPQ